jgi:hypothetical protein
MFGSVLKDLTSLLDSLSKKLSISHFLACTIFVATVGLENQDEFAPEEVCNLGRWNPSGWVIDSDLDKTHCPDGIPYTYTVITPPDDSRDGFWTDPFGDLLYNGIRAFDDLTDEYGTILAWPEKTTSTPNRIDFTLLRPTTVASVQVGGIIRYRDNLQRFKALKLTLVDREGNVCFEHEEISLGFVGDSSIVIPRISDGMKEACGCPISGGTLEVYCYELNEFSNDGDKCAIHSLVLSST